MTKFTITNDGAGTSTKWKPLDAITVDVKVKNGNVATMDTVMVQLALLDSNGVDQTDEVTFTNKDENIIELGDLSKNDDDTVTFEFKVPATLGEGDYNLVVKAFEDGNENAECIDHLSSESILTMRDVKIERETNSDDGRFIAFDEVKIQPTQVTCGDSVILKADAYNVGDEDQDRVKVMLSNTALGLSQFFEVKDLTSGDNKKLTFTFNVPQNLADGTYNLVLDAAYDYKSGSGSYDVENLETPTTVPLKIVGCQPVETHVASISAALASDVKAGSELTITTTITNLQSSAKDFVVSASGYDSWATLSSISDRLVTLNAGASKQITIKLNVNKDASGDKTFAISAQSGSTTDTRDISVNVPAASTFSFGGNSLIWIIGIINVVLIVLIVFVAIRLSRR